MLGRTHGIGKRHSVQSGWKASGLGEPDETVKVWDVDSAGEELWTGRFPTYVNRAVFFPDDQLVALAMADSTCQIWDPRAKRRKVSLSRA